MSMFQFSGNIDWDEKALNHLLNEPTGAVGRHMKKIGLQILAGARAMVGVRTGRLKRSLHMRHSMRGRVQYISVGSNEPHAHMHHEGTRRHVIHAHEGRLMRFNVGGRVVYARKVMHPGTKPRKYLTIPMNRAVR